MYLHTSIPFPISRGTMKFFFAVLSNHPGDSLKSNPTSEKGQIKDIDFYECK